MKMPKYFYFRVHVTGFVDVKMLFGEFVGVDTVLIDVKEDQPFVHIVDGPADRNRHQPSRHKYTDREIDQGAGYRIKDNRCVQYESHGHVSNV